ncbi:MAG TPA: HAMP domain-containing sensor histidine kinase, partial [Acidimicrobiales bacterium]|nr:HAMP domain-containing sensor histidine kinase [Acidimicrobiales bacterium]
MKGGTSFLTPLLPSIPAAAPGEAIHEAFVVNGSVAQRVVIGQVGALVSLILGAGLALALLLDGHYDADDLAGLGLVGMALGAILGFRRGAVPLPTMDVVTVGTEVALGLAGIYGGDALHIVLPAIYVSIGTTVCLIRPMTGALLHMAAFVTSYGAVLVFGPPVPAPLTRWLAVVAAIAVSATFVRWLVRRVVEVASAEHRARLEIDATTEELAEQDAARTVFLAKMSHEFRTPLNSIVGFSDVLREELDGPLEDIQRELVADIGEAGRDLLALVDDLLDVRRVEEGEVLLRLAEVDLCDTARTVERLLVERAAELGVGIRVHCPSSPLSVRADPLRVRQILWNLVGNAIKYSPAGAEVDIAVADLGRSVQVVVTDRGPGIEPGEAERIFGLYQQGAMAAPGSGIGLALCRRLSEAHGGSLVAAPGPDGGSRFTLELPRSGPRSASSGAADDETGALTDLERAILVPGSPANRLAIARVGTEFARSMAVLLPLFAVITPGPVRVRLAVGALGLLSLAVAGLIRRAAGTEGTGLRLWLADAWAFGGFLVIAVAVVRLPPVQDVVALSFGWPVLSASALSSTRRLVAHAAMALTCYAVALAWSGQADGLQHWVALLMIVTTNAVVVRWVTDRLRASIVGLFDARLVAESAHRQVATVSAHKRDFLASTSHELITPLNAVIGASAFLRDEEAGPLSPAQLQHLDDIHESGLALLRLLTDVLDYAKLEDGRLPHVPGATDLCVLAARAVDEAQARADRRGISLTVTCPPEATVSVVDPEYVRRVLGILIVNAIDFTEAGGRVDVEVRRTPEKILLSVRDTGVGIQPSERERVFEPFHQGARGGALAGAGGSGLGLPLARGLARLE